jgi:hypothetical protein
MRINENNRAIGIQVWFSCSVVYTATTSDAPPLVIYLERLQGVCCVFGGSVLNLTFGEFFPIH